MLGTFRRPLRNRQVAGSSTLRWRSASLADLASTATVILRLGYESCGRAHDRERRRGENSAWRAGCTIDGIDADQGSKGPAAKNVQAH